MSKGEVEKIKGEAKEPAPCCGRGSVSQNQAGKSQVRYTEPGKCCAGWTFRLEGGAGQRLAKTLASIGPTRREGLIIPYCQGGDEGA